jgi:hypothetical protein
MHYCAIILQISARSDANPLDLLTDRTGEAEVVLFPY